MGTGLRPYGLAYDLVYGWKDLAKIRRRYRACFDELRRQFLGHKQRFFLVFFHYCLKTAQWGMASGPPWTQARWAEKKTEVLPPPPFVASHIRK